MNKIEKQEFKEVKQGLKNFGLKMSDLFIEMKLVMTNEQKKRYKELPDYAFIVENVKTNQKENFFVSTFFFHGSSDDITQEILNFFNIKNKFK